MVNLHVCGGSRFLIRRGSGCSLLFVEFLLTSHTLSNMRTHTHMHTKWKTPPRPAGSALKRRQMMVLNNGPHSRSVLQLSHKSYSPTMCSAEATTTTRKNSHNEENAEKTGRFHMGSVFKHFSSLIPRGNVSSPTCSPRRKLVAALVFTQVRIYRVNIDDRRSHDRSIRFGI